MLRYLFLYKDSEIRVASLNQEHQLYFMQEWCELQGVTGMKALLTQKCQSARYNKEACRHINITLEITVWHGCAVSWHKLS